MINITPGDDSNLTRSDWVQLIAQSWRESIEGIIQTGQHLIDAKEAIEHGEFVKMCESDLPFGYRHANRLMSIAGDKRISNVTHGSHLPTSISALYEITKLKDDAFENAFEQGVIASDTEANTIRQITKSAKRKEIHEGLAHASHEAEKKLGHKLYGLIALDPPWKLETWSDNGRDRTPDNNYRLMTIDEIKAIEIPALDHALMTLWGTPPMLDQVLVGSIDRSRHPDLKAVILIGFNDGVFPQPASEDAILGDEIGRASCRERV